MDTSMAASEKTTIYANFPQFNELCCVICKTDFIEVHETSTKSNFYLQTLKCRLIIHLVSDVIASPVMGTENFIFVITNKPFFETGKLETILRYLKLVYQGVRPITTELYKNCLFYTIQSKIAPSWNKVGQYFLQGKEFYNSIDALRALKLDIRIEEKETYLTFETVKVKIPYIKLEDYLPSSVISQFLANPNGYIDLSYYKLPLVHVLPSTKKGRLLSVSKEIPTRSLFKDYDQIRRHWKNMYGYSLPKNKHGIIYYEIKFFIPRSNIFTYPNLCVAIGQLDTIPNREKELTITCFLSNMLEKVPKICGNQLLISKKPLNENLPSSGSLGNNILGEHFKGTNDPVSTLQLEFSTKLVDELKKDTNITNTLLETQLDKIHQIHNSSLYENMNTDLNNSDVKENQSDNVETVIGDCTEASTSRNSGVNCTITNQEQISRYFKIQKPHCVINKEKRIQEEKQQHITLKEKLLKAKCNESNSVLLQELDQDIDIEAMAKNNKLHEVKNTVLVNWLKKHSIPYKSKGTKAELIKKVLSHLKNTQVLKQYRL